MVARRAVADRQRQSAIRRPLGCARECPLSDHSGQKWILARDGLSAYDPKQTSYPQSTSVTPDLSLGR